MLFTTGAGSPEPLGVTLTQDGVNVAVWAANAEAIDFCLFDETGETEIARIRLPQRTGDVFHGFVAGVGDGALYGLRAHGAFAPEQGHRFDSSKLLLDPFALEIDRRFDLTEPLSVKSVDSARQMPKARVRCEPPLARPFDNRTAWSETVLYEMHVRGFTMLDPDVPEHLRGTFAGLAQPAPIARLKRLGVTAIELMPCMAWIDERHLKPLGLRNYWGYNPVAFLAPDPLLAPGGWDEVRNSIAALHEAGIEVILDVVFNHTGEGDELGPTLSLRGFDNAGYYRLNPDNQALYVNDMGCGNCLALDRAHVIRLVMDSLRAWARYGGVDGFRFDLATALGRRPWGFEAHAPLITAIEQDPVLRDLKMIAEPWDIGPGGYQVGAFSPRWGEWNDKYRDDMRRFWRGDHWMLGAFATRFAGSSDLFARKGAPSRGVNFITAHDGFTLADLVAHERKHNEANGENNRDGTDANHSWNNGQEGATGDASVHSARALDQRNLLATLLLARGTPMFCMGSETGHSQGGNNNAYAQDNAISWIDWSKADASLVDFTAGLIALRKNRRVLHDDHFLTGQAQDDSGIPDVAWLSPSGAPLREQDWNRPDAHALQIALYAAADEERPSERILIAVNASREPQPFVTPTPRDDHEWRLELSTVGSLEFDGMAPARSIIVLAEHVSAAGRKRINDRSTDRLMDQLAAAAGIAPTWWDISGKEHVVPMQSKRALLTAMRFDVSSEPQIRESLRHISDDRCRRILPHAHQVRAGAAGSVPYRGEALSRIDLEIRDEFGSMNPLRIDAARCRAEQATAPDGTAYRNLFLPLPDLPAGRYKIALRDRPDMQCCLTVAPSSCHVPTYLLRGETRFGIAAHLYTLHDEGAQGIGDFGTLRQFAARAARHGASTVGLNPLHAMFGAQRDRVSPYQPSDRNFIDPIYIDLRQLTEFPESAEMPNIPSASAGAFSCDGASIDYGAVWDAKKAALEAAFSAFFAASISGRCDPLTDEFNAFVVRSGESLDLFARHEAIAETQQGRSWLDWPRELQDCRSDAVRQFVHQHRSRHRFNLFLQWLCERQLTDVARRARREGPKLGLLGDLAIGMAPDGAEAWRNRDLLAHGVSVGAPPDPLGPEGQNWGLPPLDPLRLSQSNYAPFIQPIAAAMKYARALRIDHVLGLARLFWIPDGGKAEDGAYVAYPAQELIGQIALESQRAKCLVVGEDLGTVPEGLTERLSDANILSYRVLWFEREHDAFRAPQTYPQKALACVSTHDLPTLNGWWSGADISERRDLGFVSDEDYPHAMHRREDEKRAVVDSLRRNGFSCNRDFGAPLDVETAAALHGFLAASPAWLMLTQADDLAGEMTAVNLPGTDRERPNWRRRIGKSVEQLFDSELAAKILAAMAARAAPATVSAPER